LPPARGRARARVRRRPRRTGAGHARRAESPYRPHPQRDAARPGGGVRAHVAEAWVEAPLQRFVDDARVQFALLLHPSGQVLGQFGFTRAVDVMAACALGAAIHASAGELGRELYHAGRDRQVFIGEAPTERGALVLLTAFDAESSLGLVQVYFRELREALR